MKEVLRFEVVKNDSNEIEIRDNETGHNMVFENRISEKDAKAFCKRMNRLESFIKHREKQNANIVEMLRREI